MSFTPCNGGLTASITADCANPRIKGYEQIGIIINKDDIDIAGSTVNATNSRTIEAITLLPSKKPFALYNSRTSPLPFNGTKSEYQEASDDYLKTVQFYFEGIGSGNAEDVVEPLKNGEYVIIIPRKDHRGNGSFQVFGWQSGMRAKTEVQDEETGYWLITMTANEPSAELAFYVTSYAATKTAYDALKALIV